MMTRDAGTSRRLSTGGSYAPNHFTPVAHVSQVAHLTIQSTAIERLCQAPGDPARHTPVAALRCDGDRSDRLSRRPVRADADGAACRRDSGAAHITGRSDAGTARGVTVSINNAISVVAL
jgi:hypothetical protein